MRNYRDPHLGKDKSLKWGLIFGDVFPLRYLSFIVKAAESLKKLSRAFDRLIGLRGKNGLRCPQGKEILVTTEA